MSCSLTFAPVVYPRSPDPTWDRACPAQRRDLEHKEAQRFVEVRTAPEQNSRSNTYDVTLQFEYKIEDGVIQTRCRTPENQRKIQAGKLVPSDASALTWHRFDGSGVPHDTEGQPYLKPGEWIVGISVASDIVAAATNTGQVYLYKPTKDTSRPTGWYEKWGSPKAEIFLPPHYVSWSLGCAMGDKLEKRVDFMHPLERTTTYTDDDGHVHDVGFVATIVAVERGGKTIRYGDTGLAKLGRGLVAPLPHDPTASCLKISAAGSTLFTSVARRNRLNRSELCYFVMGTWDYESCGASPGFHYAIEGVREPQPIRDGRTPLGEGVRALPWRGWVQDRLDGIHAHAKLSPDISAHVTGHGSTERILRISAQNELGQVGYYHRKINETVWIFELAPTSPLSAPVAIRSLGPSLAPGTLIPPLSTPAAVPLVKRYTGMFLDGVHVALPFHHFLNSMDPVALTLSCGAERMALTLRFTDCWGFSKFSEMLGTFEQPKPLNATISLSPEQLAWCGDARIDTPLIGILRRYFMPYHNKVNALVAVGCAHKLTLHSTDRHLKLEVKRPVTRAEIESSFFMQFANEPHLTQVPHNKEAALVLLQRNQKALRAIKEIHRDARSKNVSALAFTTMLALARPILARLQPHFDAPIPHYGKLPVKRMGAKALSDVKGMFQGHMEANASALTRRHFIYEEACRVLEVRIDQLERLAL